MTSITVDLTGQVAYSEDFGTGCSTGNLATSFGWTVSLTGVNESTPNIWYVSAAENGNSAGSCGSGCGNDRTLHLSAHAIGGGDVGAAYLETSPLFCGFGFCARTNKRVESPTIDCSSIANVVLSFVYMENGEGSNDQATLEYSCNNGSTWTLLHNLTKTPICVSLQGQWAAFSISLPSCANNNPNVKIGFNWTNNANGVGTDPSFAVDDILVEEPLPVIWLSFNGQSNGASVQLDWQTASEINNNYFSIERAGADFAFESIETLDGAGNSSQLLSYTYQDKNLPEGTYYYRIKQVDYDGAYDYSHTISADVGISIAPLKVLPNPSNGEFQVNLIALSLSGQVKVYLYSASAHIVHEQTMTISPDTGTLNLSFPDLKSGIYHLMFYDEHGKVSGARVCIQ